MPSGLQVFSENLTLQIDSDFTNLALVRKEQISTATYSDGARGSAVSNTTTRASITLYANEVIAFSCGVPCALVAREGNTAYFNVAGGAGTVITCWVFSRGSQFSSSGMQVFNERGELTFDSSWKLMNFVTVIQGIRDPGGFATTPPSMSVPLSPGRQYAVVHSNIQARIIFEQVYQGVSPAVFLVSTRRSLISSCSISGSNITVSSAEIETSTVATQVDTGGINPGDNYGENNNNVTPTFAVIDVTGY